MCPKPLQLYKTLTQKENVELKRRIQAIKPDPWFYNKFFKTMPNKLLIPLKKYGLGEKRVLDLGCGYGSYLVRFGPDSVGLDLSEKHVAFVRRLGFESHRVNLEAGFGFKSEFDAVWATDILEHLFSPHLFLLHCKEALKPEGLLFICVPLIPKNLLQQIIPRLILGFDGYASPAHINAFTRETVCFGIERAGFQIIEASPFVAPFAVLEKALSPLLNAVITNIVVVARVDPNFAGVDVFPPPWIDKDYGIHSGFDYQKNYSGPERDLV